MADKKNPPNFPDILGKITGGERLNISLVQVALSMRPRVIRAGKPFETILLVQNASDAPIDFVARVKLPDRDAKGKKGRFVTKVDRLVIGLEPAQVGYIILPVSTLPDTAISADYSITLEVQMKPASNNKPRRIRVSEGGGDVDMGHLADGVADTLHDLSRLNWTVNKVSSLRSNGLELKFGLMSGTVGSISDLKPGWESLWTLADLVDDSLMLNKFRKQLADAVLPQLTIDRIYPTALNSTMEKFQRSGFPLSKWEAIVVAKIMTLILTFAAPSKLLELIAGQYNIQKLLVDDVDTDDIKLPYWTREYLRLLNREPRALEQPVKAIFRFCYEPLLKDAMNNSFERVESALSEKLGSIDERETYIEQVTHDYEEGQLSFSSVYLPLVLGGITAADMVLLPSDNMEDAVHDLREMVDARRAEYLSDETVGLFDMTDRLMEKVLLKYGYDAKRM